MFNADSVEALENTIKIVEAGFKRTNTGNDMTDESKSYEQVINDIELNTRMTGPEKLFAKLFANESMIVVRDMDMLTLRAHREELAKIAFEAKVRFSAADAEEKRRDKTQTKSQGFERSVNTDESTTEAINTIKERQKRLSKSDKIRESLSKLMSAEDVERTMSARNMLSVVKKQQNETPPETKTEQPLTFNPFAKKA